MFASFTCCYMDPLLTSYSSMYLSKFSYNMLASCLLQYPVMLLSSLTHLILLSSRGLP